MVTKKQSMKASTVENYYMKLRDSTNIRVYMGICESLKYRKEIE